MSPVFNGGRQLTLMTGALANIRQDIALMARQRHVEIARGWGGGLTAMAHRQVRLRPNLWSLACCVAGLQGVFAPSMIHDP